MSGWVAKIHTACQQHGPSSSSVTRPAHSVVELLTDTRMLSSCTLAKIFSLHAEYLPKKNKVRSFSAMYWSNDRSSIFSINLDVVMSSDIAERANIDRNVSAGIMVNMGAAILNHVTSKIKRDERLRIKFGPNIKHKFDAYKFCKFRNNLDKLQLLVHIQSLCQSLEMLGFRWAE